MRPYGPAPLARLLLPLAAVCCRDPAPDDGHDRMVRALAAVREAADENPYIGGARNRALRKELAGFGPRTPVDRRIRVLHELGLSDLRLGNVAEAIERLGAAHALARDHGGDVEPGTDAEILFELGVAYLRLGETRNCCARWNPDSCILPIRGGGVHSDVEGSESAMACFVDVAAALPAAHPLHRASVWLMNLAAMTLGRYPDGVPETHRIPAEAFRAGAPFPAFRNVAASVGLHRVSLAGGAAADDFDGDGDLDLIVSSWDPAVPLSYRRNDGDGRFTDRSEEAGVGGILGGLNLVHADYDNDGDLDVLVLRGAWLGVHGLQPNSLLRNAGDGTFRDVTFAAGLGEAHYPTQTAAWADYDNDGDLDLYVGNEADAGVDAPGQLFRNRGDGTFEDVAREAGVRNDRYAKAVAWGDYDGDRWPDLYVSNYRGANRLYRNRGDGTFEDVAPRLGVTGPHVSFPAWFWDYDNDGVLDLFVAAYGATVPDVADYYLGRDPTGIPSLYRGDEEGGFTDVARAAGIAQPTLPMGSNFGDLDNDGWLDFRLGTGNPAIESLMPNLMFRNRGGRRFDDVTFAGRFGNLQKGHAVVFADLDDDGDQDVFEEMGGAYPADPYTDVLYENPGFGNRWISVRLEGRRSNRWGVGARVRVVVEEAGALRSVYRHVNSGGSFGGNPFRQTIGLGKASRIERLEVYWPTSDTTQTFRDVPFGRWLVVTEGDRQLDARERRPFRLGGAR